jgi:hypothetical protein
MFFISEAVHVRALAFSDHTMTNPENVSTAGLTFACQSSLKEWTVNNI